ncbi:prepilin-type N-terminal cleavage/methylation domain-containing protein [Candidatus Daviesbacteria bacterium]|nr:prepilin-type N-terminal cleavage/methylation domain-containing protein [Candidatus Daviesbacteria bacterium]
MRVEKGLTLVEVLIAMGITAIVGVLLLVIIVNSAGLFTNQSSKVQMGLNSNDALVVVRSSIKQAYTVAEQYTNGSDTYTSGSNQLVLQVPAIDSSNSVITDTYDYYIFYLDSNTLHFKVFPDSASSRKTADRIFSTSIDNLTFQYFNSAIPPREVIPTAAIRIKMTLVIKQRSGASFETNIATSEANLRNI